MFFKWFKFFMVNYISCCLMNCNCWSVYVHAYVFQKQPPEVFSKKVVPQNFAVYTGKHPCWSLFLIKLQAICERLLMVFSLLFMCKINPFVHNDEKKKDQTCFKILAVSTQSMFDHFSTFSIRGLRIRLILKSDSAQLSEKIMIGPEKGLYCFFSLQFLLEISRTIQ